jgi:hypothetical protein
VQDDDAGNNSGSAYVFQFGGAGWVEQAKLAPSGVMTGARFGWSVALQDDTLVVGARESKGNRDRVEAGAAYVYQRAAGAWSLSQALFANDAASYDHFGNSVAYDSGVALVGAPDKDNGGLDAGTAYVYSGLAPGGGTPAPQPCETMMAENESSEGVATGVNLAWASAFRCEDAPDQGRYRFTVTVTNSAASPVLVAIDALTLTHTTPRPGGQAPQATGVASGLPVTIAPGASDTFTVSGTYELASTDEGRKANLHFCASGQAGAERFHLGLNALLRGPDATEDGEDLTPPVITNITATSGHTGATIRWTTDEPASSQIVYGRGQTQDLAQSRGCSAATSHQIELVGLLSGATYSYWVESRDGAGNLAVSETRTFTTQVLGNHRFYLPLIRR